MSSPRLPAPRIDSPPGAWMLLALSVGILVGWILGRLS